MSNWGLTHFVDSQSYTLHNEFIIVWYGMVGVLRRYPHSNGNLIASSSLCLDHCELDNLECTGLNSSRLMNFLLLRDADSFH